MEQKYALGILGLGVMGRSLALNFERNGYSVIGYDLAPRLPAVSRPSKSTTRRVPVWLSHRAIAFSSTWSGASAAS